MRKSLIAIGALILAALILWQCSDKSTQPGRVSLGQQFTLKFGESVTFTGDSLTVSFGSVATDSRRRTGENTSFWYGVAEIGLNVKRPGYEMEQIPLPILGGPDGIPEDTLAVDTLGYRFEVLNLQPGSAPPNASEPIYEVTLRVSGAAQRPVPTGQVAIVPSGLDSLLVSSYQIKSATIEDDSLTLAVSVNSRPWDYYQLFMSPDHFAESNPVQADLYLLHATSMLNSDSTRSLTLKYSVAPIVTLYHDLYGSYDPIIFNIYEYSSTAPQQAVLLRYLPAGSHNLLQLTVAGNTSVAARHTMTLAVSVTSPFGTTASLKALQLPEHSSFVDHGDRTGTFLFAPDTSQVGDHQVVFVATDGSYTDTLAVTLNVWLRPNQAPVLNLIGDQSVLEGQTLTFDVTADDPDSDAVTITAYSLPVNASLQSGPTSGSKTFHFSPGYSQSGSYPVLFVASDGLLADSETVTITVENVNRKPVITTIPPQVAIVGDTLQFAVSATDPDGGTLTLSAVGLPTNASFVDSGSGKGGFNFVPALEQVGDATLTFIVSDGEAADSEKVVITTIVSDAMSVRILPIPPQTVVEGDTLVITVIAVKNGAIVKDITAHVGPYDIHIAQNPSNIAFVNYGTGKAVLTFTPDFTQAGAYYCQFYAREGVEADTADVGLTVTDAGNHAPVWFPVATQGAFPGLNLQIPMTVIDPDVRTGGNSVISSPNLPPGASIVNNHFTFQASAGQVGVYTVDLIATDEFDPTLTSSTQATIYVHNLETTTGDLIPLAVGNYWVYETSYYQSTSYPGPGGRNYRTLQMGIDSVEVTGVESVSGDNWWTLSKSLWPAGDKLMIRNDSVFSSSALQYIDAGTQPITYSSTRKAQRMESGIAVPTGAYRVYYLYSYDEYPQYMSYDDLYSISVVRGIGIVSVTESIPIVQIMSCDYQICTSTTVSYRLLRFHVQ